MKRIPICITADKAIDYWLKPGTFIAVPLLRYEHNRCIVLNSAVKAYTAGTTNNIYRDIVVQHCWPNGQNYLQQEMSNFVIVNLRSVYSIALT